MEKSNHEIRDPIHVFVRLTTTERKLLDSSPFQRLRNIHQLAMTYLVYPGATHRRFEHSLGVMELAGRVYTIVTQNQNVSAEVKKEFSEVLGDVFMREYWGRVVRLAALVHDIGHLPFSHAAEKDLLPEGWTHERLTKALVESDEMREIWDKEKIKSEDVIKVALGPKKLPETDFKPWETILSEIIVGDAFGVDRMDYLLRDSHHTGVAYGRFDHYRLIDTLRILPEPPSDSEAGSEFFALGVQEGGVQSAEALVLARYFMYSQVYFHPIRRIYDIHLKDYLKEWLPGGFFSTEVDDHLKMTDTEIIAGMRQLEHDVSHPAHIHARRILKREHFKRIYSRNPKDVKVNPEAGKAVFKALCDEFGSDCVRHDRYIESGGAPSFPVELPNGNVEWSWSCSETLKKVPSVNIDYVFADREIESKAETWVNDNLQTIIKLEVEGGNNG